MAENTPSPSKKYYSIREVSEMLDVKAHVLRYWETQFPMLRPRKSRAGARMYQDRDLDALQTIKQMLYDRGYTIAGAKRHLLKERRGSEGVRQNQLDLDFVPPRDRNQLRQIRNELVQLRDWLAQPRAGGGLRRARRQTEISVEPSSGEG